MNTEECPPDYPRIQTVDSWEAFVATPLAGDCNGICWRRELDGDFEEVARLASHGDGVQTVGEALLRSGSLSVQGQRAAQTMLEDLGRLRGLGHEPGIECVERYPKDTDEIASTDVYSFHVDSATVPTETFLCTYAGRSSEGLRLDQAQRIVDVPETRAGLLERFGEGDGESFAAYLRESHLDLHYAPLPGARPFSFGVGNLWRLAVQHPASPVPAFIHRAPADGAELVTRLLLIS